MASPLALNEDGSAVSVRAFQTALRKDPAKLQALEQDKELANVMLGEDEGKVQETLRAVFEVGELAGQ
jgi:hypothetical protein